MYNVVAGSCAEQKANAVTVNPNLYNLNSVKAIHELAGNDGVGINFNAGAANSAWLTGMQVIGTDMYISNRGNNNNFDSTHVLFSKLPISSTGNGAVVRQNPAGLGINSCEGFGLDSTETKIIIADHHGNQVRSGTLSQSGSSLTVTLNGSSLSAGGGIRYARWNDTGTKYYFGYQNTTPVNGTSKIKQYATSIPYVVQNSDALEGSIDLPHDIIADLIFNPDGSKMYLAQHIGFIHEYDLLHPYDITSGTLTTTLDLTSFYGTIGSSPWWPSSNTSAGLFLSGISWNADGSKLYVSNLYASTLQSKVNGTVNPATVTGDGGTRTNTMPVIEFRVQ